MWRKRERATVLMRQSYTCLCLIRSQFLSQQNISHGKNLRFIHDSLVMISHTIGSLKKHVILSIYFLSLFNFNVCNVYVCKCWLTFSILGQSCEPHSPPEKSVLRVREGTTCFIFDFQNWLHFVDNFLLFYLISLSHYKLFTNIAS